MAEKNLQGVRVAILATDGVEEVELTGPRKALMEAGAKTMLVAPKSGRIQAMNHHDKSSHLSVDSTLATTRPEDFDALLLPGGALNADALRVEAAAQDFVRRMDQAGKPIAVICHGPWLLASAGLVKGHTLTSYHTIRDDVRNAGGQWVDEEVVRDQNWVSSRQPADLPAFNREMIALFSEKRNENRKVA